MNSVCHTGNKSNVEVVLTVKWILMYIYVYANNNSHVLFLFNDYKFVSLIFEGVLQRKIRSRKCQLLERIMEIWHPSDHVVLKVSLKNSKVIS